MIGEGSRYSALEPVRYQDRARRWRRSADGGPGADDGVIPEIAYTPRRFLPQRADIEIRTATRVGPGERLDQLATRTLGEPLQFWQICDANLAMDPFAIVERPGAWVAVPAPRFEMTR